MASCRFPDLLVEGIVLGTPYRKLLCYDISDIDSLRGLKARLLDDLKCAGAPVSGDCEVVLRNYGFVDLVQRCPGLDTLDACALSEIGPPASSLGRPGRLSPLLSAAPSPRLPLEPSHEDRLSMLAIVSRQLHDRTRGNGSVLPLEARVKPAAKDSLGGASHEAPNPSLPTELAWDLGSPCRAGAAEVPAYHITIRDFRGRSHSVRVTARMSVQRLKQGIAAALGCSVVSHWRLCLGGRPLAENLDLEDYNIGPGAVIDIQMTSQHKALLQVGHQSSPQLSAATATPTKAATPRKRVSGGGGGGPPGLSGSQGPTGSISGSGCGTGVAADRGVSVLSAGAGSHKGSGATGVMAVQVLLPSGQVVFVPRAPTDDIACFTARALDAARALQAPLTADLPPLRERRQDVGTPLASNATSDLTAAAAAQPQGPVEPTPAQALTAKPAVDEAVAEVLPRVEVAGLVQGRRAPAEGLSRGPPQAGSGWNAAEKQRAAVLRLAAAAAAVEAAANGSALVSRSRREQGADGFKAARRDAMQLSGVAGLGQKLVALLLAAAAVVMAIAVL